MKYLLILLLPLFTYAQEMPIGTRSGGVWSFSPDIKIEAQAGMDSVFALVPKTNEFTWDSVKYQNDSLITMFISSGGIVYVDRMFVQYRDDTLWTAPDPATTACGNICSSYDCVGGCYKTATCGCLCDGLCNSSNLGVSMNMTVGEMCRERILTVHGNEIPRN